MRSSKSMFSNSACNGRSNNRMIRCWVGNSKVPKTSLGPHLNKRKSLKFEKHIKSLEKEEETLKLVSAIFINFLFFHQMIALQKL